MFFNFFGVFDDFSFSTKGSIEVISVGMEGSNGIPMEIFRALETNRSFIEASVGKFNTRHQKAVEKLRLNVFFNSLN